LGFDPVKNVDVSSFGSQTELAQAAAEEWLKGIDMASFVAPYCVALSGGRVARVFCSVAADLAKARHMSLASIHFFWGDERCVPPDDPESNFALARQALFEPLNFAASQIHRVQGEAVPATAAARAAEELCRIAPLDSQRQPILDLIFLGMGEDGHVASLFPGEAEELRASQEVYRPVVAVKPPPHRITLGYAAIAAARNVWVLASGAGKVKALEESLAPDGQTPLARVLKLRSHTWVLTDIR
jgi:6-phosphogluconolactonase